MDLNIDCQLLIVENLPMTDLLSLAETSQDLQLLVGEILRCKFAKKTMIFRSPYHSPIITINNLEEFHDRIEARNVAVVMKILEKFGHFILHLDIFHGFIITKDVSIDIFRAVNSYCSDTLTELHISNWNDIFNEFKKPLKKLEYLSLEGNFYRMSNSNLTFGNIFPSLYHLTLRNVEFANASWLDHNYPYLHHLTVDIWNGYHPRPEWRINRITFKRLIESNTQISSLTLKFPSPSVLQIVADQLICLESLEIVFFQEGMIGYINSNIRFHQLKTLIVNEGPALEHLVFDNLVEFESNGLSQEWINLVKNQKSLKQLRINRLIEDFELLELVNIDANLTHIYFQCENEAQVQNIVQLIEGNQCLTNLHVHTPKNIDWNEGFEALQEQLPHHWNVIKTPFNIDLQRME